MRIEIEYCGMCAYLPNATSLAAELKEALSVDAKIVEGSNGAFEVVVDGELIFSKKATQRFPDEGEIARLLQGR